MGLRSLPTLLLQSLDLLVSVRPRVLRFGANLTLTDGLDGTALLEASGGGGSTDIPVINNQGHTIFKGTAVHDRGFMTGDFVEITEATQFDNQLCIGLVKADIANGASGLVQTIGTLDGLDTSGFSLGDELFPTNSGGTLHNLTATPPSPGYFQQVALVDTVDATTGSIYILVALSGTAAYNHSHTADYGQGGFLTTPVFTESAAPSSPASSHDALYVDSTTHHLTRKTSGGVVVDIETLGGTPAVATDAIWDTKGDLAVATGADAAAKLTAGADDTILMADAAQSTGLKWVASQTPSTQAFSDAAAQGTADTYARGDHKHGMPASPGGGGLYSAYLCYQDQKSSSTAGGTFTSGAWRTRDLNTEVADTGGNGSVASNQISLAAGTYDVLVTAPTYGVSRNALRLENITDSATLLPGTSNYSSVGQDGNSVAVLMGSFTIGGTKTIEVQHQCSSTLSTSGFGLAMGGSFTVDSEVFTTIMLWKR